MSKQTEALKLALEALEGLEALLFSMGLTHLIVYGDAEKAITALREALAEQKSGIKQVIELYDSPDQPAQPQQDPFIYYRHYDGGTQDFPDEKTIPLYTSPPAQQEPLTDEEILSVARNHYNPHERAEISFARAIEAAHGIKENKK